MGVVQSLTLQQVGQSQAGNTSTVRILWTSTQTGPSYNEYPRTAYYYVSNNGGAEKEYSVSYKLYKDETTTIVDTTITAPHLSDGTGSVSVRTWMDTDISAGVIEKTASLTLTRIPRGTVNFGASGAWRECETYYGVNGSWVRVKPYFGTGGTWNECGGR